MSRRSFTCPECGAKTLSVENLETIKDEWELTQQQEEVLRKLMDKSINPKYRFWQCPNSNCPNHKSYYQTDLNGSIVTTLHYPSEIV